MSFRNCVLVALAAAFAVSCGSSSTTTEKQKLYLTLATSGSNKVVVIDPVTDTKTTEIPLEENRTTPSARRTARRFTSPIQPPTT